MLFLKKSVFIFFVFYCCLFLGCKNDLVPENNKEDDFAPPIVSTDNVMFTNQTDFIVKIFSDSLKTNLISEMNARSSYSCKIDASENGNVFYYTYYLPLGNVLVPYGTNECVVYLTQEQLVKVNIVEPSKVNTNRNIVLIENLSTSAIALAYGNNELLPENKASTLLNQNEYGVYIMNASENLADYTIIDTSNVIPLSNSKTTDKGYIYSLIYTGSDVVLSSKSFLDLSLQEKIWKISLSRNYGKTLFSGVLGSRKKVDDGYLLFGRLGYDSNVTAANPYYALLNTDGTVCNEVSFSFIDKPLCTYFQYYVEENDIILSLGTKVYEDGNTSTFLMSDFNGYSIYDDIAICDLENKIYYEPYGIVYKNNNIFCVLMDSWSQDEVGNLKSARFQLMEITVNGYDNITKQIIYESDDSELLAPVSITYDNTTDSYVILSQFLDSNGNNANFNSLITFVDGTTGTKKNELELKNYLFNKIKYNSDDGFIYSSGSYVNQLTGKDVASFAKIDVSSASVVGGRPVTYPCNDKSLNSNFNDFVFDGDNILLCGVTGADYDYGDNPNSSEATKNAFPYIVSYNMKTDTTNWERIYRNEKGYTVYSVDKSAINSLLLELWNASDNHSYIVSAGLLGEIPEDTKLTLPQSSSIKDIEAPDVCSSVYFYDNYSTPESSYYSEMVCEIGSEISLEDLSRYIPLSIPEGYEVTGWYNWDSFEENEEIVFPYKIKSSDLHLYPKIEKIDVSIYLYENYISNEYYSEIKSFKYGDEISLDDLCNYISSIPSGHKIGGWYDCKSNERIIFPYLIESKEIHLYPKMEIEKFEVGDIILANDTKIPLNNISNYVIDNNNPPVAVICSVSNDGKQAKGIGLQRGNDLDWSATDVTSSYFRTFTQIQSNYSGGVVDGYSFSGDIDGSDNWEYICSIDYIRTQNAAINYPAFNFANTYGTIAGLIGTKYENNWYIPSASELYEVYKNKDTIQESLIACGGFEIGTTLAETWFWTSTLYNTTRNESRIIHISFLTGQIQGTAVSGGNVLVLHTFNVN